MSGDPETFALTCLRRIDSKVDGVWADMPEVTQRIGFLQEQYASNSRRVDASDGGRGAD